VVCAIGTLLQILAVIKNRTVLNGYSLWGSIITFKAILGFDIGFFLTGYYFSGAVGLLTVTYWLAVIIYKLKYRDKNVQKR